jgi:large subunit ribosomal protein L13
MQRQLMRNLKIYKGDTHPHEAQQPEIVDVKSLNRKNARA